MKTTLISFLMVLIAYNSNGQVKDSTHVLTNKPYWYQTPEERQRYIVERYTQKHMKNKEEYHMLAMDYANIIPSIKQCITPVLSEALY